MPSRTLIYSIGAQADVKLQNELARRWADADSGGFVQYMVGCLSKQCIITVPLEYDRLTCLQEEWLAGDMSATERSINACIEGGALNRTAAMDLHSRVQKQLEPILTNPAVQAMDLSQRIELLALIADSYVE